MTLRRPKQPMPAGVRAALAARGSTCANVASPSYQRNHDLARAKRDDTKARRLAQLLDELERCGVYTKMKWNGGARG